MRRIVSLTMVLSAVILALTSIAPAQVPQQMNFQGVLADSGGLPLSGDYPMSFSIYDASSGGTQLWTEDQTVGADSGHFSVYLGSITPMEYDVGDAEHPRWLEVQVDGETIQPRIPLVSVPYAMAATGLRGDAVTAPGYLQVERDNTYWRVSTVDRTAFFGTNFGEPDQTGIIMYDAGDAEFDGDITVGGNFFGTSDADFTGHVTIGSPPSSLSDTRGGTEKLPGWPNLHIYEDVDGLMGIQIKNPNTG